MVGMAHVEDRWTRPTGEVDRRGRPKREPTERYGSGLRYVAMWAEDGRRKSKSFRTKDDADAHLGDVAKAQRDGTHVHSHRMTVGEFGDDWVQAQVHHRGSTREQVEIRWRRNIRPELGDIRLREVMPRHVQAAVMAWHRELAPATVAVAYAYAAAIFRAAVRERLIATTPCVGINLPAVEDEPVVPLTVAQVHEIADRMTRRYRGMVWLGAATGMRSGEMRGLTLDRLTLADQLVVRVDRQLVRHVGAPDWGRPKTPSSVRTITVDDASAGKLARHIIDFPPHPSGLVFTSRTHGPVPRTSIGTAWRDAVEDMGLPPRSGWHMLRHFHASMLIASGLSPTAVAARLGHKDVTETLRTYAHLWPNDEERAVQAVATHLWATR
jgi:integrase